MNYTVQLEFFIDEDVVRTNEEVKEVLKEIFDSCNCSVSNIKVIENECTHEEWKRGNMTVIDPDGWYYGQPSYEVQYICTKCGKIKYVKE